MATRVLVIGGTGAQGRQIVHALSSTESYDLYVLTRDARSTAAQELQKAGIATLIEGDSSDITVLRNTFRGMDACYVNTNGFAIGEKEELYWGVKAFEVAAEVGVKHFVYAGLPYVYKRSGYNPKYHVGHLDGKGRVVEFISAQPTSPMNWTVVNSCLYLEMLFSTFLPQLAEDGKTYVFKSAVGDGSAPMITLPDLALYTKWVFDNPEKARGMILDTATEHIDWHTLTKAFTEVTGKPAVYEPISPRAFGEAFANTRPDGLETRFGEGGMKAVDNLTAFMEVFRLGTSGSQGLWPVEYERLDNILPGRVKSVAEWMMKVNYTGDDHKAILKTL